MKVLKKRWEREIHNCFLQSFPLSVSNSDHMISIVGLVDASLQRCVGKRTMSKTEGALNVDNIVVCNK